MAGPNPHGIGGADRPPKGEPICVYKRFGVWGKALRDAFKLAMSNFAGGTFMVLCTGLFAALFFVGKIGNYEGDWGIAVSVIIGIFVGLAVGAGLIAAWCRWVPRGRREHWETGQYVMSAGGTVGHYLESKHLHKVINLSACLTDPNGNKSGPKQIWRQEWYLSAGDRFGRVDLGLFGVKPMAGKYRLDWITYAEHRVKPVVIATEKWTEPTPRPVPLLLPIQRPVGPARRPRGQG